MTEPIKRPDQLEPFRAFAGGNLLGGLFPPFGTAVADFILDFNSLMLKATDGILSQVGIFSGFRSFAEQEKIYLKKLKDPGFVAAAPGMSWHNYGFAIDLVFDSQPRVLGLQASWESRFPWETLGTIGKEYGLEWAGDWPPGKNELCHFQKRYSWGAVTDCLKIWRELKAMNWDDSAILVEIWKRTQVADLDPGRKSD